MLAHYDVSYRQDRHNNLTKNVQKALANTVHGAIFSSRALNTFRDDALVRAGCDCPPRRTWRISGIMAPSPTPHLTLTTAEPQTAHPTASHRMTSTPPTGEATFPVGPLGPGLGSRQRRPRRPVLARECLFDFLSYPVRCLFESSLASRVPCGGTCSFLFARTFLVATSRGVACFRFFVLILLLLLLRHLARSLSLVACLSLPFLFHLSYQVFVFVYIPSLSPFVFLI